MTYQILIFSLWRLGTDWIAERTLIFTCRDLSFLNNWLRKPTDHVLHLAMCNLMICDLDIPVFSSELP
jgi:hypothetical protein